MNRNDKQMDRRSVLKASSLIFIGLSFPSLISSNTYSIRFEKTPNNGIIPEYYPNIDPEVIAEVVSKSHFDLERVKELVDERPELSKSVWEWRFGDFESAIGAASHVGRRDIALYLLSNGARPTIFTFAMLGAVDVIMSAIESVPGIQKSTGPHGISLLDHAYAGERMKEKMTTTEIDNVKRTIDYLELLGDAGGEKYIDVSYEEQKIYVGDYNYGDGEKEGFTVGVNMRKQLSLGPIGGFGGALYKIGENKFTYNGAPSVIISFNFEDKVVKSLKITDPSATVVANKI